MHMYNRCFKGLVGMATCKFTDISLGESGFVQATVTGARALHISATIF